MTVPRNLEQLRVTHPDLEQVKAADAYIAQREEAIREARAIRDAAVRRLIAKHGPAKTRDLTGYSASTIRLIRGRPAGEAPKL